MPEALKGGELLQPVCPQFLRYEVENCISDVRLKNRVMYVMGWNAWACELSFTGKVTLAAPLYVKGRGVWFIFTPFSSVQNSRLLFLGFFFSAADPFHLYCILLPHLFFASLDACAIHVSQLSSTVLLSPSYSGVTRIDDLTIRQIDKSTHRS